ncbi:hypothetical protein EMPS_03599 [Entomortierella parvispora]|uniref:Uncharacterized protein n=1 Tax=Entomortierella parvispora TaxID=205924 RepID=A0A9P3H6W7_9FUNG|nr:hypothetical protein EMPS_03599 [Entomortierella parvispora]
MGHLLRHFAAVGYPGRPSRTKDLLTAKAETRRFTENLVNQIPEMSSSKSAPAPNQRSSTVSLSLSAMATKSFQVGHSTEHLVSHFADQHLARDQK